MLNEESKKIIDEEIVPKVQNGELALFIGAGTSIGTPSLNKLGIPSTTELISRICIEAGYPASEANTTDLQTAFGVGQDDIDNFENFLISNFTATETKPWHTHILKMWWRAIFTTNIDNILDLAIERNKIEPKAYPDYITYNYKDKEPVHTVPTSPPLVYLHGSISKIKDGFVFDSVSYADNTVRHSDWMTKCALNISHGSCLFVGSKFKESDIEAAIRKRNDGANNETQEPNWIVLRSFTQMERNHYSKRGITPIEATADDFFSYLHNKIEYISPIKFIKRKAPYLGESINTSTGWFSDNFEQVSSCIEKALQRRGPYSRFYMGDLPDWFYIAHNVPAKLPIHQEIINTVVSFEKSNDKFKLIAVTGPLGAGKTTACMMAAKTLATTHQNIHYFSGLNGIDIEHTWRTIKDIKGLFCIFIDAASSYFYAIDALIGHVLNRSTSCKLCIIVEERTRQFERNKHHFTNIPNKEITHIHNNRLNYSGAESLYDKALSLGIRFEKLETMTRSESVREIIDFDNGYKGDLLATLYDLSSRKSYKEQLSEEYQEIDSDRALSIYQTISLVTAARLPLPLNFICESNTIEPSALHEILTNELKDKIHIHGSSMAISTRHHSIAEYHLSHSISKSDIKERLIHLMKCLSNKFSIDDIKNHPISYKIYRATLSYHHLTEVLFPGKANSSHVHEIYSTCQSMFSGDGVFWLQYGRFLEKDGDIPGAIHCFRKGLGLYDSFQIRHALGQTLLKHYTSSKNPDKENFNEGAKLLLNEIDSRGSFDAYPYTSLGYALINMAAAETECNT